MFGGYERHKRAIKATKSSGKSAFQRQVARRDMTDNQIAALSLKLELDVYTDIAAERRRNLRNEMTELEPLSRMNMRYLAGALFLIEMSMQTRKPIGFKLTDPAIRLVLETLGVKTGDDAPPPIKSLEVLLTYVSVVSNFRTKEHHATEYNPDEIYEEGGAPPEDEDLTSPAQRIAEVGKVHLADYDDED